MTATRPLTASTSFGPGIDAYLNGEGANAGRSVLSVGTTGGLGQYFPPDLTIFDSFSLDMAFEPDEFMFSETMDSTAMTATRFNAIAARGKRVVMVMQPSSALGANSNAVLDAIVAGAADAGIKSKAALFAGHRAIVRVLPECNGNFNTFGQASPAKLIAAFHYVVNMLRSLAPDITIEFSVNNWMDFPFTLDPTAYYPGDAYVDRIGIDPYSTIGHNLSMQDLIDNTIGGTLTNVYTGSTFTSQYDGTVYNSGQSYSIPMFKSLDVIAGFGAGIRPIGISECSVTNSLTTPGSSSPGASATTPAGWWTDLFNFLVSVRTNKPYGNRFMFFRQWNRPPYNIIDSTAQAAFKTGLAALRATY